MIKWKCQMVKVSDLKEYSGNPRRLMEKGMEDLKKTNGKFGLTEPLCCNPDLTIIGGHARKKTLELLNIKEVNVFIPERELAEEEIKELNIRLNKNVAGEFDFDMLANEFDVDDLCSWGFEEGELIGYDEKDLEIEKTDMFKEIDNKMELISFMVPSQIKKQIEKQIGFITDGEAVIRTFPSVELNIDKFISKQNISNREIGMDEAFYAFVSISFFRYLKQIKRTSNKLYNINLLCEDVDVKEIYEAMVARIKTGNIHRNAFMKEIKKAILNDCRNTKE